MPQQTSPASPPGSDPEWSDPAPGSLPPAEPPGWAPVPEYPGPRHPDDVPPQETPAEGAGGGAAAGGRARTRASTSVDKVTAGGLAEAMAAIWRGGGELLNKLTAQDEADRIWLVSEDEAAKAGEPLGRIIARRVPDLPGDGGDLADGITAAIPVAIWAVKGLAEWLPRMRKRRKTVPGQVTVPDLGEQAAAQ